MKMNVHNFKHKDAHRILAKAGWDLIKGAGKGAHKKYKKAGCKPLILSVHGAHLDPKAVKDLAKLGLVG